MIGGTSLPLGSLPSDTAMLSLVELVNVRLNVAGSMSRIFAVTKYSFPLFVTVPRFWNCVGVSPSDGASGIAIRRSSVRLL